MRHLIRAELHARWRSGLGLTVGSLVWLLALSGTYAAFGGQAQLTSWLGATKQPSLFSAFAGSPHADLFAPSGFLAFGFEHPLFLVLALVAAVGGGVAAVAGDVETGRAELVYTTPVRRALVYDARLAATVLLSVLVTAGAVVGAEIGRAVSSDLQGASAWVPVRVAAQLLPLLAFFTALTFLVSATSRSRATAQALAVTAAAAAYVANMVSLLWWPVRWLGRFDPFHYFPAASAAGRVDPVDVGVLLVGAVLLALGGRVALSRRDLA